MSGEKNYQIQKKREELSLFLGCLLLTFFPLKWINLFTSFLLFFYTWIYIMAKLLYLFLDI